ncbi:MAG TPA: protein translocase subunit SecD [candidate division Zixibacteria bacterium]|nr:protein translocase subunit SecD [candidate division Zixibacteria bacterium]
MRGRDVFWFVVIVLMVVAAIWMILNPDYPVHQGLDLEGGLQVLLEADVPEDREVVPEDIDTARQIVSQRVNAIGVVEPLVQIEGDRRILVELPGIENPELAIELIQGTALLEFVDTGPQPLPEGLCVRTSLNEGPSSCELTGDVEPPPGVPPTFNTVLTGDGLRSATSRPSGLGRSYSVGFELEPEAAAIFEEYTRSHQGQFLTIVLDKRVISSPQINSVISDSGSITGDFTLEEAQHLALQLRYGSLPIPLRIERTRLIGATLGEQSIQSSIRAGIIGVSIVLLFMAIYYRLPGVLADIALLTFALLNFAIFKWLSVTLTLPAIAGFLLSTGMAVDANVLVFERIKEEIRHGESLRNSIEQGFDRAWPSIRDSNVATLVICFILWIFGRNFGASMVQGFAITLAIGVMVSMFTAIVVTRTLVRITIGAFAPWIERHRWLLGI